MPRSSATKLLFALFLAASPAGALAGPGPAVEPTLLVSVFNDAGVGTSVLTRAEARASHVLGQTGITVQWLNCSPAPGPAPDQFQAPSLCSSIAFPAHLSVRIVSGPHSLGEDAFGQSFLDASGVGAYSNVYYGRLAASSAAGLLREEELLGYVIAHELGHLLLGPNSHSPAGVMCARWSPDQLRLAARASLFFSPQQGATIRSRLAFPPQVLTASTPNSKPLRP